MEMTLRLLVPDKKGIGKRIARAIETAGGRLERQRVRREMRGISETEIVVSVAAEPVRQEVVRSLGEIPGVAVLGAPEGGAPWSA